MKKVLLAAVWILLVLTLVFKFVHMRAPGDGVFSCDSLQVSIDFSQIEPEGQGALHGQDGACVPLNVYLDGNLQMTILDPQSGEVFLKGRYQWFWWESPQRIVITDAEAGLEHEFLPLVCDELGI